jgi:hypothetical protein
VTSYRRLVLRDFWPEARMGLNLAFYRTYAVPSIARLLFETGEITGRPVKRAYDTGLVMYELIAGGPASPRGRRMLDLLTRVHRRHPIADADYRYVLGALIFIPTRWIDRFGPRRLTDAERAATFEFYRSLGAAMGIPDLPDTWDSYEAEFDAYEKAQFAFDPAGAALFAASQDLMVRRLPLFLRAVPWIRRLATAATAVLLEPPVRAALGVASPSRALELVVHGGLHARGRLRRLARTPATDRWTPGRPNAAYPAGYTLDEIGPD